ncbi:3-oxoacyl-of acyl-carrier-protein synthase I [Spatholobus suberectus]|nr:3-oxoacyl-of acyl-carrier-protein synthase I [Spatholobus suberectus]
MEKMQTFQLEEWDQLHTETILPGELLYGYSAFGKVKIIFQQLLERGEADIIVVGGTEAAIMPTGVGGFIACRALSQRNEDPKKDFKTMGQRPWFYNG